MTEFTLQQKQALALTSARLRMADSQPVDTAVQKPEAGYTDGLPSMKTVKEVALPFLGIGDRLKAHYAGRDAEIQKSVDATVAGQQSEGEMMTQNALSNASKFTDTVGEAINAVPVVGPAITGAVGGAMHLAGKLPVGFGSKQTVGEALSGLATEDTRFGRNIRVAGQAVNLGGAAAAARSVGNAIEATPRVQKYLTNEASGAKPTAAPVDALKIATENYGTAKYLGEKFTPDEVSNKFAKALDDTLPKPIAGEVLTAEDTKFINSLGEYANLKGKEMTLDDLTRLDQTIGQKITKNHVDNMGNVDAQGRLLSILQTKLRGFAEDAGKTGGNDARMNGVNAWATKARMQDVNALIDRAEVAVNKTSALQAGARALYNDKDRIAGWPQEAVDALHTMAKPGIADGAMSLVTSRLPALVGMGSGDFTGAIGLQLGNMAGNGVKGSILAKRGMKVQEALGNDLMSKLRDVKVPAPEYLVPTPDAPRGKPGLAGLLPAPKQHGLSTGEAQTLAEQLRSRPAKAPVDVDPAARKAAMKDPKAALPGDPSGNVVKILPPSRSLQMDTDLKGIRRKQFDNISEQLRSGKVSQNKFVETAVRDFGLTKTKATQLAKEVVKYPRPPITSAPKPEVKAFPTSKPLGKKGVDNRFEKPLPSTQFKNVGEFKSEISRLEGQLRLKNYEGFEGGKSQMESQIRQMKVVVEQIEKGVRTGVVDSPLKKGEYVAIYDSAGNIWKHDTIAEVDADGAVGLQNRTGLLFNSDGNPWGKQHDMTIKRIPPSTKKNMESIDEMFKANPSLKGSLKPEKPLAGKETAPKPDEVFYHGGNDPLLGEKDAHYFTSDKSVARDFRAGYYHNTELSPAELKKRKVHAVNITIKSAAPTILVRTEAAKLGVKLKDFPENVTATLLDRSLNPKAPELIKKLKSLGYDGAILPDAMSDGSDVFLNHLVKHRSHIVFDKSQIKPIKEKK